MQEQPSKLIGAAIGNLEGDAEAELAAAGLLEESTGHPFPKADAEDKLIARWQRQDRKKFPGLWKAVLYSIAGILFLAIALDNGISITKWRNELETYYSDIYFYEPSYENLKVAELDPSQRLIVGDPNDSATERAEKRWRSDPENLMFFAANGSVKALIDYQLPPDYLKTAAEIDPDNSFHLYLAAGLAAKGAVREVKTRTAPGVPQLLEIVDQTKVDQALELFHRGAKLPDHQTYRMDLREASLPFLPDGNPLERQLSIYFLLYEPFHIDPRKDLMQAVSAGASQLAEAGERERLQQLVSDFDVFWQRVLSDPSRTVFSEVIAAFQMKIALDGLEPAARQLGLQDADRLAGILIALKSIKDGKGHRSFPDEFTKWRSSILMTDGILNLQNLTSRPPKLTDRLLEPLRMQERWFAWEAASLVGAVLMGVIIGLLYLFRLRSSRTVLKIASRLELLLTAADWCWILGAGVVLPFGAVSAISNFSPLGGMEWGFGGTYFLPVGQFLALLLLMICVPVLIARWRITRRAGRLGIGSARSIAGWLSVAGVVAFLPVMGWIAPFEHNLQRFLPIAYILGGGIVLWLVVTVFRSFVGRARNFIFRQTVARALVPAYALGGILLLVSVPIFHAAAMRWFRLDELSRPYRGSTWYEYQIADGMRSELREALGLPAAGE